MKVFYKDLLNATVSVLSRHASKNLDAVVVLKSPKLEGDKLTFDVQVLEGKPERADGPAAVFIDIIGRPLTPFSFAGVARRSAFRGAMHAGAAYGAAAAYGAVCGALLCTLVRHVAMTLIRLATNAGDIATNLNLKGPFSVQDVCDFVQPSRLSRYLLFLPMPKPRPHGRRQAC